MKIYLLNDCDAVAVAADECYFDEDYSTETTLTDIAPDFVTTETTAVAVGNDLQDYISKNMVTFHGHEGGVYIIDDYTSYLVLFDDLRKKYLRTIFDEKYNYADLSADARKKARKNYADGHIEAYGERCQNVHDILLTSDGLYFFDGRYVGEKNESF